MEFKVDPKSEPKFRIGQKIWFINGKKYKSAVVISIGFVLCENNGSLLCRKYFVSLDECEWVKINNVEVPVSYDEVNADNAYESEDVVKKLVEFHLVTGISEEEWLKAIGNRDNPESIERCELPPCCGNISQVRSILTVCKMEGGLVEYEVRFLEKILRSSHLDYLERQLWSRSVIGKIFKQLGIISKE